MSKNSCLDALRGWASQTFLTLPNPSERWGVSQFAENVGLGTSFLPLLSARQCTELVLLTLSCVYISSGSSSSFLLDVARFSSCLMKGTPPPTLRIFGGGDPARSLWTHPISLCFVYVRRCAVGVSAGVCLHPCGVGQILFRAATLGRPCQHSYNVRIARFSMTSSLFFQIRHVCVRRSITPP
ncbi:hypothetical protein DUNSADRAFT_9659 [Dunaliella salina]|uniref:Encoded protein n=1 Tax=Dunaliella salina TaxID=3046 RepID=A0ABQ7GH32_DUNSA|nr:hypothetical protein DUNSADRAFT_9659 [Dunaliella salina]|eukprot:KAF5833911.1 hypothetical protein DUNSADRAFT_9659 [Dunaliella salina]